jgi:MoaA/NifB/PqqE/SkfB family radical SAM enzyme
MIIDRAELKRRYYLRITGARDKKVYIGPEDLALEINNSCNLTCQYCWFHAPGNPTHFDKSRHFPWEKFLVSIADAVDLKVDNITITGSGEPTMHPLFRKMMRHLENQPLNVKVLTNATFPLEYCSDVIRGDSVLIDLSAVDRQQYLDLQGKDLFDRVVGNIQRLVSLRDAGKPGFQIDIVYIVNAVNIDQKSRMQDLASQLGVNSVIFKTMNIHDYNRGIALPEAPVSGLGGEVKRSPAVCLHGWFYMIVKADDDNASTCCRIPNMRLGDFDRWSLKQLWLSPKMMNMRLLGKYGQIQKMYKACQTCPFYDKNVSWTKAMNGAEENAKAIA